MLIINLPLYTTLQLRLIYLHITLINMGKIPINRIKVVLAEKNRTNKWLAEGLGKNETTVSRWCTNESQPSAETFFEIAKVLDVDIKELFNSTKASL